MVAIPSRQSRCDGITGIDFITLVFGVTLRITILASAFLRGERSALLVRVSSCSVLYFVRYLGLDGTPRSRYTTSRT